MQGFALANNTDLGLYDELQKHPERSQRFANAMSARAARIPVDYLFQCFDWQALGKATVVDVGGSHGSVAIALAQRYPDLSLIVQDFANVVAEGAERLPKQLRERIHFMSSSFLEQQPVEGAEVYFFRAVFHNWPDASCIQILRNQIPALKPGSRIIINDGLTSAAHLGTLTEQRAL